MHRLMDLFRVYSISTGRIVLFRVHSNDTLETKNPVEFNITSNLNLNLLRLTDGKCNSTGITFSVG